MINPSNRTLIGSLRIEQKPIEQKLTHKMMATRLLLVVNSQIILESNIGLQFFNATLTGKLKKSYFLFLKV